jgi:hypothetical protein
MRRLAAATAGLLLSLPNGLTAPAPAVGSAPAPLGVCGPIDRRWEAVEVAGASVGGLRRAPFSDLALVAVRGGAVHPIPFQVDERDESGTLVYNGGPEAGHDTSPGRLDHTDTVLLMACDLGERADPTALPPVAAVAEIAVRDPADGRAGWAYLLANAQLGRTDARYVAYDPATDTVTTARYTVGFTNALPALLALGGPDGFLGANVLDRMKLRVAATWRTGVLTWRMTEADIASELLAYAAGPVRVVRRTRHRVDIGLGLRVSAGTARTYFYATHVEAPGSLKLPFSPAVVFRSIIGRAGADFRDLRGWRLVTPAHPAGIPITGRPAAAPVDESTRWFALAGPQHTLLFALALSGELARVTSRALYLVDDEAHDEPPEHARGQVPGVGYRMTGGERVPKGRHRFSVRIFDLAAAEAEPMLARFERPLVATVTLMPPPGQAQEESGR